MSEPLVRRARRAPGRRMSNERRARLGGLTVVANRGPEHMAGLGRLGQTSLDRRIAAEAGIDPEAPDYLARLKAARTAYFIRLAERRWIAAKVR